MLFVFHHKFIRFARSIQTSFLKGQGHEAVKKPIISRIHIVAHTWPLCSAQIFVDGVNPQ